MKYVLLLGALLLSASPAVADEFVYLECETKLVATIKDLKSNQITKREEATETTHHKVDIANSRILLAKKLGWEKVKIVDGVVDLDKEFTEEGFVIKRKGSWQVVPPGRFIGDSSFSNDTTSTTFKARGMCKASDASVFKEALNQQAN